jgi:tetratricopeptide (TPR) repeat protein
MNLGVLARATGDYESALDFLHRACRHLEAAGSAYAIALSNLGTVYHALGRLDDAATALSRSIELCETYGAAINLSFACAYLSATVRRRGDPAEATELARRALRIAIERDLPGARAEALNTLGEALLGLADPAEAEACFTAAIAEAERARLPRYVGRGYEGLAHASAATGDPAAARRQRNRALAIYPAEAAAAAGPRAHLLSPSATCARCAVDRPHRQPPGSGRHAPVPLPSAEQAPRHGRLHLR